MVRNFALVYLEMGFKRLIPEEASKMMPALVKGISKRPSLQQQTLLHILLPLLPKYMTILAMKDHAGAQPFTVDDPFGFQSNPADAMYILDKFADVMLYAPPLSPPTQRGPPTQQQINAHRQAASLTPAQRDQGSARSTELLPPGLSRASVTYVTNAGKATWCQSHVSLREIKLAVLRFNASTQIFGLNTTSASSSPLDWFRFRVHLIASVDGHHEVQSKGEDGIKRIGRPDMEDVTVVTGLFALYQGTVDKKVKEDDRRTPATNVLKQKVLVYLSKSVRATNVFPGVVQVVFDALYGESSVPFCTWNIEPAMSSTHYPGNRSHNHSKTSS
ncbi:hypothetical protein HDU93_005834 [Gonapodya sp. JEL0774]|nr:hypothetical protein HDU93_005834 [Gonapodya sp. JEL0774]